MASSMDGRWRAKPEAARTPSAAEPAAFVDFELERGEGGSVHDVVAFAGGTWVAQGTAVGRLVEAETEALVLDPVIRFSDGLPRRLAVMGDVLAIVEPEPAQNGRPSLSRVWLWRAEDVAKQRPSGWVELPFVGEAVAAFGSRLAVVGSVPGTGDNIIALIDAGTPGRPRVIGSTRIADRSFGPRIASAGSRLFVNVLRFDEAVQRDVDQLLVYDMGGDRLVHAGTVRFESIDGSFLFAAEADRLLVVEHAPWPVATMVDVSRLDVDPLPIVAQGSLSPLSGVASVTLDRGRAILVDDGNRLVVFDPLQPIEPQLTLPFDRSCSHPPMGSTAPWVVGEAIFRRCDGLREERMVPGNPQPAPWATRGDVLDVQGAVADGRRACAWGSPGAVCTRLPYGPIRRLQRAPSSSSSASPRALALDGDLLLASELGSADEIVFHDPDGPDGRAFLGQLGDLPRHVAVALSGSTGYVLLADGPTAGVQAIDARDPASPVAAGFASLDPSFAQGRMAADGGRVVVAVDASVTVLDASDALSPRVAGSIELEGTVIALGLREHTAFIGLGTTQAPAGRTAYALAAIDVSDADAPRAIWRTELGGRPHALAVDGDDLIVAERTWLRVFDLGDADGGPPVEVASMALPTWSNGLAAGGGRAVLALGDGGLWIVGYGKTTGDGVHLPVGFGGAAR